MYFSSNGDGFVFHERLAKSDPGNAGWQRDLSMSYSRLAWAYIQIGQLVKAHETLLAGRGIIARLVTQFPDQSQWNQDLAWFDQLIAALKD